jgi:hypothetical protein
MRRSHEDQYAQRSDANQTQREEKVSSIAGKWTQGLGGEDVQERMATGLYSLSSI